MGRTDEALLKIRKSLSLFAHFDNNSIYTNVINEIMSLILEWSPDREELLKKINEINKKNESLGGEGRRSSIIFFVIKFQSIIHIF